MRKKTGLVSVFAFATGALFAVAGLAQSRQTVPSPQQVPAEVGRAGASSSDAYGTSAMTVVKIHGTGFRSQCSGDTLDAFWDTGITYRSGGNVNCMIQAPVQLPAGALVTQVGFDGYDVDPTLNINWGIYWVSADSSDTTGFIAWYTFPWSGGSFNTIATLSVPPTVDPNKYYFAQVELTKLGQDMRIKGMRVVYKLQVSPAPGTATFTDVPTNYWAFQYIEALAASGITSGCGGGNFCPGATVTRDQMAVFLAKALGLHWPN
jgi:hypothetical protein